jgi:2'-5' RNA ligase superfamily
MAHLTPVLDAPAPTQTAVIAPVPAAEPLVAEHRRHLDPADAWGVPAHVTVLFPFVEPAAVNEHVITTLVSAVAPIHSFDCCFVRTRWFGHDVLWLEPRPTGRSVCSPPRCGTPSRRTLPTAALTTMSFHT